MFIPDKCVVSRHIVEASVGKRQCPSPSLLVKVTPVYLLVNKCECVTYLSFITPHLILVFSSIVNGDKSCLDTA